MRYLHLEWYCKAWEIQATVLLRSHLRNAEVKLHAFQTVAFPVYVLNGVNFSHFDRVVEQATETARITIMID